MDDPPVVTPPEGPRVVVTLQEDRQAVAVDLLAAVALVVDDQHHEPALGVLPAETSPIHLGQRPPTVILG
jgi:hypothetical protein